MSIIHLETSVDFINLPLWEEIKILKNSSRHIVMAACKNKYWWNIRLNYYMILYLYCVRFSSRQNYLSGLSTWMPTKNILIKKKKKERWHKLQVFFFYCNLVWSCVRLQFNDKIPDGIVKTWDFCFYFCKILAAFNKFKIMSEDRDSYVYEQMTDELEIQYLTIL